ncbi:MAG: hypothetical protein ACJAS6_000081 [Rickettsiales bacterium]|jgi:hypothetical protein
MSVMTVTCDGNFLQFMLGAKVAIDLPTDFEKEPYKNYFIQSPTILS